MKLPLKMIPEEIIQQYNIRNLAHKDIVCTEIKKGMYELPQAEKLQMINLRYIWPSLDTSQHPSP